ncbi:MAG: hypothetical protein NC117_01425 [Pseudoflavonifractor sp.]|nr:hypothetical protein [Pseudoflavonifractor sp.]
MKSVRIMFAATAALVASTMLTSCDMWYDTGVGGDINYVPGYIDVTPTPPVIGTNIWYNSWNNSPAWWYPQGPVYGGGYLPGNIRPGASRPPVGGPNIPPQSPQRPSGGNRPLGPNIPR